MWVIYFSCSYCDYEVIDGCNVGLGAKYANGRTVICPECGEETFDYEMEEQAECNSLALRLIAQNAAMDSAQL